MPTFRELFPQYYTDDYQQNGPERPPDPNPAVSPISAFATMGSPNPQGTYQRYEDQIPYQPNWWERMVVPQSARETYMRRAQQYNTIEEERDRRRAEHQRLEAQTETQMLENIPKIPIGPMRDAGVKAMQRWYKARNIDVDPGWWDLYKKSEEDEIDLYRQVAESYLEGLPPEKQEEARKSLMRNPEAFVRIQSEVAKYRKMTEETRKITSEIEANKAFQKAFSEDEAPGSSVGPPNALPSPQPRPMPNVSPGPSQGPLQGSSAGRPSVAERHNNLLNMKLGGATMKWVKMGVAQPGELAKDGGRFLRFQTPEQSLEAGMDLLKQPFYADKTIEEAMRAWSNKAYGAEIAPGLDPSMRVGSLSPQQTQILIQSIAKAEGSQAPPSTATQETASPEYMKQREALEAKITKLGEKLQKLSDPRFSSVPAAKANFQTTNDLLKFYQTRLDNLDKLMEPKAVDKDARAARGLGVSPRLADRTPEQQRRVDERIADIEAEEEKRKFEATMGGRKDISAAQGENAERIKSLSDEERKNLRIWDAKKDDWVKVPATWNRGDLQKQEKEVRHMPPMEGKPAEEYRNLAAANSAANEILPAIDSPEVQKEIGSIFSNPTAWLNRVKAKTGKDLPESVYKLRSGLSRLQATLQRYYAGTAQTATELRTLDPFIAHIEDPTPKNVKAKLESLIHGIEREYNTRRDFDLDNGSYVTKLKDEKRVHPQDEPQGEAKAGSPVSEGLQKALDFLNRKKTVSQ